MTKNNLQGRKKIAAELSIGVGGSSKESLDLTTFLDKKPHWYDPDELIPDPNFLPPENPKTDEIGQLANMTYVVDPADGYAKPEDEVSE